MVNDSIILILPGLFHRMIFRNSALVNALAEKGHNLTILSVDTDPDPPKNVHYIHMEGVYDYMYKEIFVDLVGLHNETAMHSVLSLYAFGTVSCIGKVTQAFDSKSDIMNQHFKVRHVRKDFGHY